MKPSKLLSTLAALTLALSLSFTTASQAQEADKLPNYVPVLPQVKARALAVDPQKGYLVKQVKPDVYVITDGIYQSAFVTTSKGVILFDAPESFARHIVKAVAEVTREPIVQLVYSHAHLDHIAGAGLLVKQVPKLTIVAEVDTAAFLRDKKDARRPLPTSTFKNQRTLKLGTMTVELKKGQWHSPEGDLLIYLPGRKFLMAIDTLAAGHVPFMDFDLSTNMHAYLKVFDQLLAYDFDVLVPGHLTYLADRQDVQMTKDYALDVYKTVKRIHDGTDQMGVMSQAAQKYSWDNKFAIFRTLLDGVAAQCTSEIQGRWIDKLAGVDVFGASHCRAALIYARWDDCACQFNQTKASLQVKAYVIESAGGPEVLQLRDMPTVHPQADEVRIRVRAFGLNRAEVYRRAGKMGPITAPVVPGIEAVGEVLDDPSGTLRTGQRVATAMGGLQFSRAGSYAEEVTVLRSNVVDLDGTSLSWEELAALPESYITVWGALGRLIEATPDQTLLVRGASSSVGQAAVAYAKARGLRVVATTRSTENAGRLTAIGADAVVIDSLEIAAQLRAAAPQGIGIALEVVGASTVRDSLKALKPFGTAVVVGLLGSAPVLESLHLMNDLPAATRLAFFPSGLFGTTALPASDAPLKWIAGQVASGAMPSLRVQTFDFDAVRRAHSLIESDRAVGKLVVMV